MEKIYVDHAASTPIDERVITTMIEAMKNQYGNPSSIHSFGRDARKLLDEARQTLAQTIEAKPNEIVLTSGGTEANNLAIFGYARANKAKGNHIITSAIEHHAVLDACKQLEKEGFRVTYLPVNKDGYITKEQVEENMTDETILIAMMHANNETGVIQPANEIARLAKEKNIAFHTDAVQTYGVLPISVKEMQPTMMAVSSHKINGPKGIGFLYVKEGTKLIATFAGGEQEKKRRPGTENLPAIAGFATAAKVALEEREQRGSFYQHLTDSFVSALKEEEVPFQINGDANHRVPHIVNIYFPWTTVESFLVRLDFAGIAASSGSACTAGSLDPSHVLTAMFPEEGRAQSSVRFSVGKGNTKEEMEYIAREIKKMMKII